MSNPATIWANTFVDELARAGVRYAVIAPGSRSTPLTFAFSAHPDIRVYSLLDERSAAFFALGIGLATGNPAVVLCTSGTAAANFYPAIIEAHESHVPMLVLTADRPPELRGTGANQTIDQVKMFGGYPRWFMDVALPEIDPAPKTIRYLRTTADRAVSSTHAPFPGPVHLNFPFRKPLEPGGEPVAFDLEARPNGEPYTKIFPATPGLNFQFQIDLPERGIILAGPNCPDGDFPYALVELAEKTGYPIVADVLSGLRFGPWVGRVPILNPQTSDVLKTLDVSLIIQFGSVPTAAPLLTFLANLPADIRRISVQPHGAWQDDAHTLSGLVHADPVEFCRQVGESLPDWGQVKSRWAAPLIQAEQDYWRAVDQQAADGFFEGLVLADVVEALPDNCILFVTNSNPVRHLDEFARPAKKNIRVFANRGVSGIDGTISTALGIAAADQRPLVLVTGDLSFYHDMNGLLALERCGVKVTIVLINNNGGGIFQRLPVSKLDPPFTDLFLTPHGLDFEPAARMYGAEYILADGWDDFRNKLRTAISSDKSHVIEVQTDSGLHESARKGIMNKLTAENK